MSGHGGRPSKVNDTSMVNRVIDAIALGCTYEAACTAGPISVRTFYEWMGRAERDAMAGVDESPYVVFADRVAAANLEAERRVTEMWVAAIPTDWRAARDFLERRFPSRWRRPQNDPGRREVVGGYTPPEDFLAEEERIEALCDAIEAFVARSDAEDAHTDATA